MSALGGVVIRGAAALLLGLALASAQAQTPQFGRYMPLYPGQYLDLEYSIDDGERVFDAAGREQATTLPNFPGQTRFPRRQLQAVMSWHFPFFEAAELPFISSRTWVARVSLGHASTATEGALVGFITDSSDDADTDADDLRNNGSGIGDLGFELGTYLFGSPAPEWRQRERAPLALLLSLGLNINTGEYDRDAPVSSGNNSPAAHVALGFHAQPWRGAFIDAGLRFQEYFKNQDAAFGALAPTQQGDDWFWDLSLAQRLGGGFTLGAFLSGRDGQPNAYDDIRFTPTPPAPPPGMDNLPAAGRIFDQGRRLVSTGLSLSYFLTQRLQLSLSWIHPLSGQSGEIDVAYQNRFPAGCTVGTVGCLLTPGATVRSDGLGPARALASDRLALSLRFQFLERDTFDCVGCER